MKTNKKSWSDLNFKDKLAFITCIVSFALGWLLTIAGFIVSPIGEVSQSVLWILGQSLLYTASVIGITTYVKSEFTEIKHKLNIENEDNKELYSRRTNPEQYSEGEED